jgi:hypothetical protein
MNLTIHTSDEAYVKDIANLSADAQKSIKDRISKANIKTKVTFKNHETGEVLGEYHNKVVISGSQFNATNIFGLEPVLQFPSYNKDMNLDNTVPAETTPKNHPVVCLFGISDSGCGPMPSDVYETDYASRIKPGPIDPVSVEDFEPDMLMPFRYVDQNADLDEHLRQYYFGRKSFDNLGKIAYYFKSFDSDPQLHLVYADGTQITDNVYTELSSQSADCYVEMRLRITKLDLRDYFEHGIGWDKARISSLTLVYGWYDDTIDEYRWYQDITPYSVLNFSFLNLVDTSTGIDIIYDIYF